MTATATINEQPATTVQVLAWEYTESGYSFQYFSDDVLTIETDHNLNPNLPADIPGVVKMPVDAMDALERLLTKVKAIKSGATFPSPALYIAS